MADINYAMRSATVEWFEQGETKGKEIDMVAITTLNPELIIVRPSERNNIQDNTSTQSNLKPLQRVSESKLEWFLNPRSTIIMVTATLTNVSSCIFNQITVYSQ